MPFQKDDEIESLLVTELTAAGGLSRPGDIYPNVTARFPQVPKNEFAQSN